jgi:hypothetical protein
LLITAVVRALAAGGPLAALKPVVSRDDLPAFALCRVAMAQLGRLTRANDLLHSAARAFRQIRKPGRCFAPLNQIASSPESPWVDGETLARHLALATSMVRGGSTRVRERFWKGSTIQPDVGVSGTRIRWSRSFRPRPPTEVRITNRARSSRNVCDRDRCQGPPVSVLGRERSGWLGRTLPVRCICEPSRGVELRRMLKLQQGVCLVYASAAPGLAYRKAYRTHSRSWASVRPNERVSACVPYRNARKPIAQAALRSRMRWRSTRTPNAAS